MPEVDRDTVLRLVAELRKSLDRLEHLSRVEKIRSRNLIRYARSSRPTLTRRAARERGARGERAPPGGGGNFTWPT